jgi:hypothetical protein
LAEHIEAVSLSTGYRVDCHAASDVASRVDLAGVERLVDVGERIVRRIAETNVARLPLAPRRSMIGPRAEACGAKAGPPFSARGDMPSGEDKAKLEEFRDVFLFTQVMSEAANEEIKPREAKGATQGTWAWHDGGYQVTPADPNRKWHTNTSKATDKERGYSQEGLASNLNKDVTKMRWGMAGRFATQQVALANTAKTGNAVVKGPDLLHEIVDPLHRFGALTAEMKDLYFVAFSVTEIWKISHFYFWIASMCLGMPDYIRSYLQQRWTDPDDHHMIEEFIQGGVNYIKSANRKEYRLLSLGGKLYQENRLFDTRNSTTAHSGVGWAIFVVSPNGRWFAGPHKSGRFHHSSFLGGGTVMAAGEMQVFGGVPVKMSAKSGHYQPTLNQFTNGMQALRRKGIDFSKCELLLYENKKQVLVKATTFLDNPQLSQRYSAWG